MPRNPRVHVPGGIYHVILRGNAREPIFFADRDYLTLNELVREMAERHDIEVYSFCWMTNHIHAVVRIGVQPLAGPICWLGTQYARYVNRRRNRSGHVFERRHRALLVQHERYLLELVRYVHRNPVQAGMAQRAEDHPWSSHRAYLGAQTLGWLSPAPVLQLLSDSVQTARREFANFVSAGDQRSDENGEILFERNTGPLSRGRALRLRRAAGAAPIGASAALDRFAHDYCESHNLSIAELKGTSKQVTFARARAEIAATVIEQQAVTVAQVARYFKRAPQVMRRGIARYGDKRSGSR